MDLVRIFENSILCHVLFAHAFSRNPIAIFYYNRRNCFWHIYSGCHFMVFRPHIWIWLYVSAELKMRLIKKHHFHTHPTLRTSLVYELVNFNLILDNICLFVIPHLLGICLGHLVYKANHNFNINIVIIVSGIFYMQIVFKNLLLINSTASSYRLDINYRLYWIPHFRFKFRFSPCE